MKILIFVSKNIGLECLKFHLEAFKEDQNYIVVCDTDKDVVIDFLKKHHLSYQDVNFFSASSLQQEKFDWLLNLWGGVIFRKDILSLATNSLNIHPSYLPYGRGRDPVVWAIRDNISAGVTLHEINEGVDEGDIWYQEEVPYTMPISGGCLYQNVVKACVKVFKEHWPAIKDLRYSKKPQAIGAYQTRKRKDLKKDQLIVYENLKSDQKEVFLKLLAHDFGSDYSSVLEINNVKFKTYLRLERLGES